MLFFEEGLKNKNWIIKNIITKSLYESLELLSDVKLGVDLGIIKEINDKKVKELYLYTKSANMANFIKTDKILSETEEEIARSQVVKQILSKED